ncbi:hypothetical protein B0H17DRAFT_688441 [Mycena rosella]|uniref:Uncharacterized protein n=1 Tax=Mycena rosella TaxID=1033263 RepID=A0AAD7DBM8_MYCRO|nr:hypothetical protein B0H17DRAFT_688441 [Mycena rosella]
MSRDTIVEAAHIIPRYLGSPLVTGIFGTIQDAASLFWAVDDMGYDVESFPLLFADVRHPPTGYALIKRTDRHDNDVLFRISVPSQALRNRRGLRASCPPTRTGNNTRISAAAFFPRCLDLYSTFCYRFLPQDTKVFLTDAVAKATRVAEIEISNHQDSHSSAQPQEHQTEGGGAGTQEDTGGRGEVPMEDAEGELPASTSHDSNSSNGALVDRDLFANVWNGIASADSGLEDLSDDEVINTSIKARIEQAIPDPRP